MSSVIPFHPSRSADRVDRNVYIGGYIAAADQSFVQREGITRVLRLFDGKSPEETVKHPGVTYFVVPAQDVPEYRLDKDFTACLEFIQQGLARNEKILVHCHAGISRSGTIVLLHLMLNRGLSLSDAIAYIRDRRPWVRPNDGFWAMLQDVDARAAQIRKNGRAPAAAFPDPGVAPRGAPLRGPQARASERQ